WLIDGEQLHAVVMYDQASGLYTHPNPLSVHAFPQYLEALHSGRAINAEDAWTDPRVNELGRGYLIPLNIRAILDASIRIDGEVVGVLCLEQQHRTRYWQADEMAFAGELADHFAQVM